MEFCGDIEIDGDVGYIQVGEGEKCVYVQGRGVGVLGFMYCYFRFFCD